MSTDRIDEQLVKETTDFHGHWCPGLAIGIRAAEWALKEMGKAPDEEIVAVVETDMCGVDAIQYLALGIARGTGAYHRHLITRSHQCSGLPTNSGVLRIGIVL